MKLEIENKQKPRQRILLVIDIIMIILVIINLAFLVFDWNFEFHFFREIVYQLSPDFFELYYKDVHPNFMLYDLGFVAIFITELIVRWAISIYRKTYYKWFYYPFIHWYDVLGCIPTISFRWFRILRIVSMTIRLHKLGFINLRKTIIFRYVNKYYKAIVEEISDRVVVNVLNGVQDEIKNGSQVMDQMVANIIKPHQKDLTIWISQRFKSVIAQNYTEHQESFETYLKQVVERSVVQNQEVQNLANIPLIGNQINLALKSAVSDITYNVIANMVKDVALDKNSTMIEDVTDFVLDAAVSGDGNEQLNAIVKDISVNAIELVKDQVKIKQWQLEEQREKDSKELK
jgi:hypothetical protein